MALLWQLQEQMRPLKKIRFGDLSLILSEIQIELFLCSVSPRIILGCATQPEQP